MVQFSAWHKMVKYYNKLYKRGHSTLSPKEDCRPKKFAVKILPRTSEKFAAVCKNVKNPGKSCFAVRTVWVNAKKLLL